MPRYQNEDKSSKGSQIKPSQQVLPTSKVTLHFPTQVQHYDEDDNTNPVAIYLRSPSKKSHKIEIPAKISILQVKNIAQQKMNIKKDRQVLYLNGKNITEYGFIRLQPHNIIHITNCEELLARQQQVELKVKIIDSFSENKTQNKIYKIGSIKTVNELIDYIKNDLKKDFQNAQEKPYYFLLQSSRILEQEKSLFDNQISRNTEIICLITKHELKTRFSNDTKQQILHDISELLGFDDDKRQMPKKQERTTRLRYPKQNHRNQVRQKNFEFPQEAAYEQQITMNKTVSSPNFKKKKEKMAKSYSTENFDRPLITKIKASKTKRQLQFLLKSQQNSSQVFQASQIKEITKKESKKEDDPETNMEIHKPAPSIPKVMPVQQRRKIRLQIEKLFDFGGQNIALADIPETKEEQKPKSPPTQQPPRTPQRQKMRFSMGSRPAFLDQLRIPQK